MSIPSRITTWIAGDTLTASALNGEFNNLITAFGDIDNTNVASGAGIVFSKLDSTTVAGVTATQTLTNKTLTAPTINAATLTGTISGGTHDGITITNSTASSLGSATPGWTSNLDITLSAGALSVTGLGGVALSSTNKGYICLPSTTAGQWKVFTLTANQTIASGGLKGRAGTTASVAWGSAMPLFIYGINKDNTDAGVRFSVSRSPCTQITPSNLNNIGIDGTAPATSAQNNHVLFGSTANTGYASVPCVCIGSVQATIDSSAGGVWTIGALTAGRDGLGLFQEGIEFTMPTGQNSAASGGFILANGGTAPVFSTNTYLYKVFRDGNVFITVFLSGDGGTDGSGSVSTYLCLPTTTIASSVAIFLSAPFYVESIAGPIDQMCFADLFTVGGFDVLGLARNSSATSTSSVVHTAFTNGSRTIYGSLLYPAFKTSI